MSAWHASVSQDERRALVMSLYRVLMSADPNQVRDETWRSAAQYEVKQYEQASSKADYGARLQKKIDRVRSKIQSMHGGAGGTAPAPPAVPPAPVAPAAAAPAVPLAPAQAPQERQQFLAKITQLRLKYAPPMERMLLKLQSMEPRLVSENVAKFQRSLQSYYSLITADPAQSRAKLPDLAIIETWCARHLDRLDRKLNATRTGPPPATLLLDAMRAAPDDAAIDDVAACFRSALGEGACDHSMA